MQFFEDIYANPLYHGVFFASPFITPNHQYPFSMKNFLKSVREIADRHGKKLMIGLEGVDPKPDQKINKKKARELIDLVDKVVIANYDCPRGNEGITIPISPMDWIKQNYDFYADVYSRAKLTPKLIMVLPFSYRPFLSMDILSLCTENTTQLKARKC
jgi:spore germination protein YaaH